MIQQSHCWAHTMRNPEVIVLHEGEMIGRGTHEELFASCPEYRDICKTQLSEEVQ